VRPETDSGHVVPPSGGIFRLTRVLHARNLITTLIGALIVRDLFLLFSFPVAVGTDGYYYVNQINSLLATGTLYYPSSHPLAFGLLVPLSIAVGDPVVAIKIGATLFLTILAFGVYAFIQEITGNKLAGLTSSGLIYASNSHLYFISEFLSNLTAIAFLVWGGYFLRTKSADRSSHSKAGATVTIVAAVFGHRSSLVIVVVIGVILILLISISRLSHTITFLSIASIIVVSWSAMRYLPGGTGGPDNPFQGPAALELIVLGIAALFCLFSDSIIARTAGVFAFAITLNPFLDRTTSLDSIAGRVSLLAHIQLAVMLPILIVRIVSRPRQLSIACVILVAAFALINAVRPIPRGLDADFLSRRSILITGLRKIAPSIPPGSFIVAPHGDQFVVTHTLGLTAQNRVAASHDSHVLWLIRHFPGTLSGFDLSPVTAEGPLHYAFIGHKELERMLAILPARDKLLLAAANPHLRSE
jgi:hypothetical protein